jgi:hypothetical protein
VYTQNPELRTSNFFDGHAMGRRSSRVVTHFAGNEAPRSSLLRRSSHFGYEGRKLRGIRRRRIS